MRQIVRENRPDVVNVHFVWPVGAATMASSRLWNLPTVLSLIGRPDVLMLKTWSERRWAEAAIASADVVLPITQYCSGGAAARDREQVIPYGVDTQVFTPDRRDEAFRARLGLTPDDIVLLTVQRLTSVKRVDVLIRVLAELVRRSEEEGREGRIVLLVVGQGEEKEPLIALAAELGVSDHVIFAGYVPEEEMPTVFASSDVFVFHSLFETFGIVFVQAMASGIPVVAANTSSISDVVLPQSGGLVTPFDVSGFADTLESLIASRDRRADIGRSNRTRAVAEFDWEVIADQYEGALRRAIELRNGRT